MGVTPDAGPPGKVRDTRAISDSRHSGIHGYQPLTVVDHCFLSDFCWYINIPVAVPGAPITEICDQPHTQSQIAVLY